MVFSYPRAVDEHLFASLKRSFEDASARAWLYRLGVTNLRLEGTNDENAALVIEQTPLVPSIPRLEHQIERTLWPLPFPRCSLRTVFAQTQEMVGISSIYGSGQADLLQKDIEHRMMCVWQSNKMDDLIHQLQHRMATAALPR